MSLLETVFQEEKDHFRDRFVRVFAEVCDRYSDRYPDKSVSIMMLQFLRTDLLERRYRYRIVFYGAEWYLEDSFTAGEINTEAVFCHYHEMENRLLLKAGQYKDLVTRASIRHHVNILTGLFSGYIRELILYSITQATETEAYIQLKKEKQFQIRVGELMEPGDLIYQEQEEKNQDLILRQLTFGENKEFHLQDYKGLDFSGLSLQGYDFSYTDFRDCNLEGARLDFCRLAGVKMGSATMNNCCIRGSMLHDADFTGSDLREADLSYSISFTGKDIDTDWRLTGYAGGSFRDTDLRGASLVGCVFCGLDFRQTRLTGADFREAGLFQCRMKREQAEEVKLSKEQMRQIHTED